MSDKPEKPKPPAAGPAAGDGTGMDKRDMKKLLKRAAAEPLSAAAATSDAQSGSLGLLLLDKVAPPRQVLRDLKEQFPTCRTPCFGTVSTDPADKTTVTFRFNRGVPGLDRRLRKTLRGTGYTEVVIENGPGGGDDDG